MLTQFESVIRAKGGILTVRVFVLFLALGMQLVIIILSVWRMMDRCINRCGAGHGRMEVTSHIIMLITFELNSGLSIKQIANLYI